VTDGSNQQITLSRRKAAVQQAVSCPLWERMKERICFCYPSPSVSSTQQATCRV